VLAAIALYAHCPLAHIELGALLERAGRARAALRRYERALQLSSDPSIDAGRAAAVGAARCSEMLAAWRNDMAEARAGARVGLVLPTSPAAAR
jgi:hypothetical protein